MEAGGEGADDVYEEEYEEEVDGEEYEEEVDGEEYAERCVTALSSHPAARQSREPAYPMGVRSDRPFGWMGHRYQRHDQPWTLLHTTSQGRFVEP
jgi:hypothetical protein